jgi:translation elongation factor EF-4
LQYFSEPLSNVTIIAPMKYTSEVMVLCKSRRGEQRNAEAIDGERIMFKYDMPTAEVCFVFVNFIYS